MKFKEVSRDTNGRPRFILKEEVDAALSSEKSYSVARSYSCHYELTCDLAGGNTRNLEFASGNEFNFFENKSTLLINAKATLSFKVVFSPRTKGNKNFQLIIKGAGRQGPLPILDRHLNVGQIEPLCVTGYVENELPIMQLGESQKVTFIFENKANREVKNFKIIIKSDQDK